MTQLFEQWLDETRKLQEDAYHIDYGHFPSERDDDPDKIINLVDYISINVTATLHELVELQSETSWKPWQMDQPYAHRNEIRGEAVDALHFIANILVALGVTDTELNTAYAAKMQVNRNRQLGSKGYYVQGAGVKCQTCKRALDDVEPSITDPNLCVNCATEQLTRA